MTHIAGHPVIAYGRYHRQLCAWCGLPLIDEDASAQMVVASNDEDPGRFHSWPQGRLVSVDEALGVTHAFLLDATDTMPDDCCAVLEKSR